MKPPIFGTRVALTDEITLTTANANYLVPGIQLRERSLVPKWLGRLILWMFFHRTDSATTITITGLPR